MLVRAAATKVFYVKLVEPAFAQQVGLALVPEGQVLLIVRFRVFICLSSNMSASSKITLAPGFAPVQHDNAAIWSTKPNKNRVCPGFL